MKYINIIRYPLSIQKKIMAQYTFDTTYYNFFALFINSI